MDEGHAEREGARQPRPVANAASDEALARRVAAPGDDGALSTLYDRYGGMVYAMGLRLLGDRSLAEDLVQDVFVSVWRKAATFDPAKASFTTWIHRMARNRATDLDRRRKSRPRTAREEPLAFLPGSGGTTEGVEQQLDVAEALSRLSSGHQEVLVLAYFEGLTQREIALVTGTPLGTVKTRTTAALRALSGIMSPERGDG